VSIDWILERIKTIIVEKDIWIIPILILGGILSFYPHFDYPFLFHVDEWFHIAQAKQIALGSPIDWYTGEAFIPGLEQGWHGLLAGIYLLFHPSSTQWIVLPTILHLLAIFSTYLFVSRFLDKTKGLISSFLIALLPTNITIGGPVFLIPVNLSLIIIPLALLFAFNLVKIKPVYKYAIIIILTTFLLYAHAPSAIVLLLILFFKTLFLICSKERSERTEGFHLLSVLIISVLLSLPNFFNEILTRGFASITFNFYIKLSEIFLLYGILPTIFFIIGFYFASKEKNKEIWALLLTSLFLLFNIVVFAQMGINILLPYQRTFLPLFLLMAIIGSIGFAQLFAIKEPIKKAGAIIFVILILTTGVIAIQSNMNYTYYQIIDETDNENAEWIQENTKMNAVMLCDPWKARALAPIAERTVYSVTPFGPIEKELDRVDNATAFLNNGCRNTSFLIEHNISIVYARGYNCYNPYLEELTKDIYLLNLKK